ncbi:MAG: hypothetical protein AAB275_03255, partial [Deltaproteobacteria bacterium]
MLNYTRAGMVEKIINAREEKRPLATIAACTASAGDKKGGFAAEVTYRNKRTQEEYIQKEMREVSEFPTRDKDASGFSAENLKGQELTEFYRQAEKNGWFIEDIFGNKKVAFNNAFYAMDARLLIARIFGLDENSPELLDKLEKIEPQAWSDRIVEIGESVPKTVQPEKKVPTEDNEDEVKGYMTEQAAQDFIVNSLALLGREGSVVPKFEILLTHRKDIFLPYKGTLQVVIDEQGNEAGEGHPLIQKFLGAFGGMSKEYSELRSKLKLAPKITEGRAEVYDLLANMARYKGGINELKAAGLKCILGEGIEVDEVLPVYSIEEIIEVN